MFPHLGQLGVCWYVGNAIPEVGVSVVDGLRPPTFLLVGGAASLDDADVGRADLWGHGAGREGCGVPVGGLPVILGVLHGGVYLVGPHCGALEGSSRRRRLGARTARPEARFFAGTIWKVANYVYFHSG